MIWGNLCNYRHPGPRRVWKGGSDLQSDPPFPADPVDPLDPLDPVQNNGRLSNTVFYNDFCTFSRKMITIFEVAALGALLAPRWPQMRFGSPLDLNLEASWSTSWRQDRPSETQDGPSETQMANLHHEAPTKCFKWDRYINKLPINRKAAVNWYNIKLYVIKYMYVYIYIYIYI